MTVRKITPWIITCAAVACLATTGLDLRSPEVARAASHEIQLAEDAPSGPSESAGEPASSQPGSAAEEPADAAAGGEAATPMQHTPPIKFMTVDYQDAGQDTGKMKLAGTAGPGTTLYLYFDDQPFSKLVADGEGKWSLESDMKLETGRHTFRAEQYEESGMLAARALVTIERVPPGAVPEGAGPEGAPAPERTTH
jgi:hypothetical protein